MSLKRISQDRLSIDQQTIDGIRKHLKSTPVYLAGRKVTIVEIVKVLKANIDATNASLQAKAAWRSRLVEERNLVAQSRKLVQAFRQYLLLSFSEAPEILRDFGLAPPKQRRAATVTTKAQAVARAGATRAARHTMGKRQKSKVKVASPAQADGAPEPAAPGAPGAAGRGTNGVSPPVTHGS
jgi:hypothetical protein